MIRAESHAVIARPVATVYDFVVVRFFDNYPRWAPEVVELEAFGDGPVGQGTRGRQVRIDQGRKSQTTFEITRLEPERCAVFEGGRDARFTIRYHFREEAGERCRLGFEFELQRLDLFMRPFEKLIRMAIQDGTDRTVRNIKGLVEAER
jgi:hypothetical protein